MRTGCRKHLISRRSPELGPQCNLWLIVKGAAGRREVARMECSDIRDKVWRPPEVAALIRAKKPKI
jgi:hypothetical protein